MLGKGDLGEDWYTLLRKQCPHVAYLLAAGITAQGVGLFCGAQIGVEAFPVPRIGAAANGHVDPPLDDLLLNRFPISMRDRLLSAAGGRVGVLFPRTHMIEGCVADVVNTHL